jgi:hypothetical protein
MESKMQNRNIMLYAVFALASLILQACVKNDAEQQSVASAKDSVETMAEIAVTDLTIDADTFKCLDDMTKVRHFFVDNLLGDLQSTLAIAESTEGGVYPPGSVVQLVPTEVMIKHGEGWNAATRDWEFFELDVSADGSSIRNRGFTDVVNRFGGNCFACHIKAEPQYDLICERDHGCDPIPITREVIAGIQSEDPRCDG